jgi:nucleotidyltransferase substrate binding protein (TIGR01987 family)
MQEEKSVILGGAIDIESLLKSQRSLGSALGKAKTDLEKFGAIQLFECSFELAWKTMRRILMSKGLVINNPRDVIREAAANSYIENPQAWFVFLDQRNLTTHTYDEAVAEKIFATLPQFYGELATFIKTIQSL